MGVKYSLITVNYNCAEKIQALWKSLEQFETDFEWIIVDNNSVSGDVDRLQALEQENECIHCIQLQENLGMGRATNEGARFAKGEFVVMLNPDIEFLEPVLESLAQHTENKNIGIICPKMVGPDGEFQTNAREFPTLWQLFTRRFLRKQTFLTLHSDRLTPVPWIQGSFMCMKRELYEKLSGFDDRFFLFFEDTDLCRRSWREKKGVFLDGAVKVQHGAQRLSDASFFKMWFKRTFWIHLSSLRKYYWKWKGRRNPKIFEANMNNNNTKQGKIFFFSGPSGVGKGTLIDYLRKKHLEFEFPPSCTTRDPRPGEVDGETYYFISKEEFEAKIEAGDFLEYAQVHGGNYYGTLKNKLIDSVKAGKIVIREFDVQGFVQARERLPREYFTSIFLKPAEGQDELIRRIKARAPITEGELEKRMESMKKELAQSHIYDYEILSEAGNLEKLFEDAEKILVENSET